MRDGLREQDQQWFVVGKVRCASIFAQHWASFLKPKSYWALRHYFGITCETVNCWKTFDEDIGSFFAFAAERICLTRVCEHLA